MRPHKIGYMLKLDDGFIRVEVGSIFTILFIFGYMFEISHNKKKFLKKISQVSKNCSGLVNSEKEIPLFMPHKDIIIKYVHQWSSKLAWIQYIDKMLQPCI